MTLKKFADPHFGQIADALAAHALKGRVHAIPFTTKNAADAAEKIIREAARQGVKNGSCLSTRAATRFVPLKPQDGLAPVFAFAVFADAQEARKFAFNQLANHQLKLFELHSSSGMKADQRLKAVIFQPHYHSPNGMHAL